MQPKAKDLNHIFFTGDEERYSIQIFKIPTLI